MWIPKGAVLKRGRRLFEARRLLQKIRHFTLKLINTLLLYICFKNNTLLYCLLQK